MKKFRWAVPVVTVAVLGVLVVAALSAREGGATPATAANGRPGLSTPTVAAIRPISGDEATKVAQKTEKLHLTAASAGNQEDEKAVASAAANPVIPPEQAITIVQTSASTALTVSSVNLTTNSSGRQIYVVGTGSANGTVYQVDAVTGQILTPTAKH